jgi:membrane protease YdiL (CAAX protease family)
MSPPTFGPRRALVIFAAFLGSQAVVAVVVAVYAAWAAIRSGAVPSTEGLAIDPRVTVVAALAGTLLGGGVVLVLARRALPATPGSTALQAIGWTRAPARETVRAALTGLALVVAFAFAGRFLPAPRHGLGPLGRIAAAGGGLRVAWAVLAVAIAPPVEELVFRGVLYSGLAARWASSRAGFVTTMIFVAMHATEIGAYAPAWLAIGVLSTLALRARLATGSLIPAVALHATYNLGLVLATYAQHARA